MAEETNWHIDIELRASTRAMGPALKEASASLIGFKNILASLEKTGGLSTLTAGLQRLAEAARGARTVFGAAAGQQGIFEWRLRGGAGQGGAIGSAASADGRSLVSAQATLDAATQLEGAVEEERAATQAQSDAAQTTTGAAGSLADAAGALSVSAADAERAWQKFSGPIERRISSSLADAILGIRQRGGIGRVVLGIEQKALSGVIDNVLKGVSSVTIEPLFKSVIGMGGPIGGIANLLFGNSQAASQALFSSAVATFTAAVGTFAAATGVQATAAGTAAVGAGASAVSTAGSVGGIFGGIKALFGFIFDKGGIVPSAAGGWALPAGLSGGVPAVLHSREMVLPADISEGLQGMIRDGGGAGAGGDVHLHFYGPTDASGVASWIAQAIGDNPGPMLRALRGTGFSLA